MQSTSFQFDRVRGWSLDEFPPLDSEHTLIIVFAAPTFIDDTSALDALVRAYPLSTITGCSTAGEIQGSSVVDESLSVAILRFDRTTVKLTWEAIDEERCAEAVGRSLANHLMNPDLRSVLVLSDGIAVNGTRLLRGLNAVLPPSVVLTGGLAGDGTRFEHTWVIANGRPVENAVVAVGLYGEAVQVGHGSRGGWDIFGPERVVTRSSGNVLYEIDGEPALALYKKYLGERAAGLPATALLFPLGVRTYATENKTLVRTILSIDEETCSMTFAGDVPEASLVQLMCANSERLIEGASDAGRLAAEGVDGDCLVLAISCVGRRLLLGERTEEEVEAAYEAMMPGSKLIGFYSYGEISPHDRGESGVFHNQTMTLTTIQER